MDVYVICVADVPVTNMLAYYPFNGNANDTSGNDNHSIVQGASLAVDRFGNPDSAYSFDGVNDRIRVTNPSDGSLDFGADQSFTLSAWVKTTSMLSSEIIEKQEDVGSSAAPLYQMSMYSDGHFACMISDGSARALCPRYDNIA